MKFRVYYEDTDSGGIMYHANYIKFCERARSEIFFRSNIHSFCDESNFVVTNINAKFIKAAKLGDMLEVKTEILEIKKASIILKQEIFNELNELIFSANIIIAHLCKGKPCRLNEELNDFFNNNFR